MFQRPSDACSIFLNMESPPKISHDSFTFRFPARLWRIINSCSTGAISWGPNGRTIRILRKKFEEEYLTGNSKPFKTAKYESFVRQLNHYGFKKVKKCSAALKKITGLTIHAESKEEATTLSEYHNPNFMRGKPERVTFLERRSQLHDEDTTGHKRKNKRSARAKMLEQNQENSDSTNEKKTKKETSVQVSHTLLHSNRNDILNTSDDDHVQPQPANFRSNPNQKGNEPKHTYPSRLEHDILRHLRAQTSHRQPFIMQPLPSAYAPSLAGRSRLAGTNSRHIMPHTVCYNPNIFPTGFSEPPTSSRFCHPLSSHWPLPFNLNSRAHLYDFRTADSNSRSRFYAPNTQPLILTRTGSRVYPPVYPDSMYYHSWEPTTAWSTAYGMNRCSMEHLKETYQSDLYSDDYAVNEQLQFPESTVNSVQYRRPSMDTRQFPTDELFWPFPQHALNCLPSRNGVKVRAAYFPPDFQQIPPTQHQLHYEAGDFATVQTPSAYLEQSLRRENSAANMYTHANASPQEAELWQEDISRARQTIVQADKLEVNTDASEKCKILTPDKTSNLEPENSQQQENIWNEELRNKDLLQNGFTENIITEDTADLPLDVVEETVITCNAVNESESDYCSPLMPYSSVEETIIIDTLMDTTAPLERQDNQKEYSENLVNGIKSYSNSKCHGDITNMSQSASKLEDFSVSREDFSKLQEPTSVWRYLAPDQFQVNSADLPFQNTLTYPWTFPASRLLEETARIASAETTKDAEQNEAERKRPQEREHYEVDCIEATCCPPENCLVSAKVLVHPKKKGTLAHLSNSSIQKLLSNTLQPPGPDIAMDKNYHTEKIALIISKNMRQELNGCV